MSKSLLVVLGVVGVVLAGVLLVVGMYFSYSNKEIALRTQIGAQQKSNMATFDAMWKIIKEQAGVTEEWKDTFAKEVIPELVKGRTGGALMKFVTEANPNFDTKLFEKLMNSIEGQRTEFKNTQNKLLDQQREHTTLLLTFPGSMFLAGRQPIEVTIVTSGRTEKAFETGKEEPEPLFSREKK